MSPCAVHRIFGAAFLLLWVVQTAALAQLRKSEGGPDLRFEHITTADGLSHRIVYDILEDHQGYLWFATRDGLNRYDGHSFKVYRHIPEDSTSLSDSKVEVLFEGRDSVLWAGTMEGGLNRFDRKTETFTRYLHNPNDSTTLSSERVTAIAQDSTGALWVGTLTGGLSRLDPGTGAFQRYPFLNHLDPGTMNAGLSIGANVRTLFVDRRGGVWVGSAGYAYKNPGLCIIEPNSKRCVSARLPGLLVESLAEGANGSIWAAETRMADSDKGSARRIYRIDPRSRAVVSVSYEGHTGAIEKVIDVSGVLWAAANHGLLRIDTATGNSRLYVESATDPASLRSDYITSAHRDRAGALWVSTAAGIAVARPRYGGFKHYRNIPEDPNTLSSSDVNGMIETRDGTLWVATADGINLIPPDRRGVERLFQPNIPGAMAGYINRVWSLYEDDRGDILIGTGGAGLHRFVREDRKIIYLREAYESWARQAPSPPLYPLDQHRYAHIARDDDGTLWFSSTTGLARKDAATGEYTWYFHHPDDSSSLSNNHVNFVFQDLGGRVWIATDKGINRFDEGRFRRYLHSAGDPSTLSANIVWTMAESRLTPGIIWVGTVGGGLNRFDPESGVFRAYTTAHGLPSNVIYGILPDDGGRLWMSTASGLSRFDPISETFTNFDKGDGLQETGFNLMAYHRSARTGEMFFGGPNGFNSFFPDSIRASRYEPPVVITSARIFDKERAGMFGASDTLRLAHDQNFFTLTFASLDYANPRQNRYRYALEGFDPDWRETTGANPTASYTGVPPGRYRFVVYGSNEDGVFSENKATLLVNITPAFWQTTAFRVFAVLMLIFSVGGVVYAFQRQRIRLLYGRIKEEAEVKRRLAESQEAERLRIARELHDGPMQALYSVGHHLDNVQFSLARGERPNLEAPRDAVERLTVDLRSVCNELRPPVLAHFGLAASLDHLVGQLRKKHPRLRVEAQVARGACDLDESRQHVIFRIAQEALNNAAQHASAQFVSLNLVCRDGAALLTVEDDGRGFELPQRWVHFARAKHFGVLGMMERAEAVGGTFRVESKLGEGTQIRAEIPFAAASHEENAEGDGSPAGDSSFLRSVLDAVIVRSTSFTGQ